MTEAELFFRMAKHENHLGVIEIAALVVTFMSLRCYGVLTCARERCATVCVHHLGEMIFHEHIAIDVFS